MKRSAVLLPALAVVGLGLTGTGASAQTIYEETYPAVVAPVVPAPGYVVRETVVAPPPLLRERTVVIRRPAYVGVAPVLPLPRYGYAGDYVVTDW
jgi:hypothetical protein